MVPVTETKDIKKSPAAKLDKSIKIGGYKDQKPTGDKELVEVINNKSEKKEERKEKKEERPKSPVELSPKPSLSLSPKPSTSPKPSLSPSPKPSHSPYVSKPTTPQNDVQIKESISQSEVQNKENKENKKDKDSLNLKPRSDTSENTIQKKKSTQKPIKNNPQPDAKFRKYKLFK